MGQITVSGAGRATEPVVLPPVGTALNDCTWEQIRAISDAGKAANYFSVGDTKTITINGTVGATTFSNLSIDAFIIGIDHNSAIEGTNRIHFKIGKISGTQVGLIDSNYESTGTSTGYFRMKNSKDNSGGWASSYMRKTILGNSNTPSTPLSGSLMAALPSDLLPVMKPVTKHSDNTGGGSNTESYVTETTDYLFLLAEYEFRGKRTYANSAEQNYQDQYDYYKAGNSIIHYKYSGTSTACTTWCRSVYSTGPWPFCAVSTDGSIANAAYANFSMAVSPAFAV